MSSKNNRFNQQSNIYSKEAAAADTTPEEVAVATEVVDTKQEAIESAAPMVYTPKQEAAPIALKTVPPTTQVNTVNTPAPKMLPVQTELLTLSQMLIVGKPVEGRWQYTLLELLRGVIEKEQPEGFDRVWGAVLMFFHRSKGTLFSELHILRMGDNWPGSENDFTVYRRLIHVITETANPETRQEAAMRINMAMATTHLSETGRNRLISYYG